MAVETVRRECGEPINPSSEAAAAHAHASQPQSAEQVGIALELIADAARTIERLSILLAVQVGEAETDLRDTQAFINSVEALAQRVGLIAERTGRALKGFPNSDRAPEDWMMPPVWHRYADELEANAQAAS